MDVAAINERVVIVRRTDVRKRNAGIPRKTGPPPFLLLFMTVITFGWRTYIFHNGFLMAIDAVLMICVLYRRRTVLDLVAVMTGHASTGFLRILVLVMAGDTVYLRFVRMNGMGKGHRGKFDAFKLQH